MSACCFPSVVGATTSNLGQPGHEQHQQHPDCRACEMHDMPDLHVAAHGQRLAARSHLNLAQHLQQGRKAPGGRQSGTQVSTN